MNFVNVNYAAYNSPVGELYVYFNEKAVTGLYFEQRGGEPGAGVIVNQAVSELDEYFNGKRREFTVPVELNGTPFRKSVWERLSHIPFGKTTSYAAVADELGKNGKKTAARAVGGAVGANPVSIIVPCHRVIGANGSLTGFAGGLERKKWLLKHESGVS